MKDYEKLLKHIMKTGDATKEDILKFMLEEYFLKNKTFSDFENDLEQMYCCNDKYSIALVECFKRDLNKYSKELQYSVCKKHTVDEIKQNINRGHNEVSVNTDSKEMSER